MKRKFLKSLKGINEIKSPGPNGYGEQFFKATWEITKRDVIKAMKEFFNEEKMYKAVNNTLVTLIPKNDSAKTIKSITYLQGYLQYHD